jgi:hypothetical protein
LQFSELPHRFLIVNRPKPMINDPSMDFCNKTEEEGEWEITISVGSICAVKGFVITTLITSRRTMSFDGDEGCARTFVNF